MSDILILEQKTKNKKEDIILVDKNRNVTLTTSEKIPVLISNKNFEKQKEEVAKTEQNTEEQPIKKKRGRPKKNANTSSAQKEEKTTAFKQRTFFDTYKRVRRQQKKDKTLIETEIQNQDYKPMPKNILPYGNGYVFNFGVRKPIADYNELFDYYVWNEFLLNKWVCFYDKFEEVYVYIKHIVRDERLMQVIYSGKDVLGDGVWIVYQATITQNTENGLYIVDPKEYSINFGSFECEDYLGELLEQRYITEDEFTILASAKRRKEFGESLMKISVD